MPWPKTDANHYHAQLGLQAKGHSIKGLIVCYCWDVNDIRASINFLPYVIINRSRDFIRSKILMG